MQVSIARLPLCAAGLAVVVAAAVSGCGTSSGASAVGGDSSSPAPVSALDAVKLAAKTTNGATSFTATMGIALTVKPGATGATATSGDIDMDATFAERLHPSLIVQMTISSMGGTGGSTLSGLTEVITPATYYFKWAYLTSLLHLSKPWVAMPVSQVSKSSGMNLSQLFSETTGNNPLAESQILGGATSVRQVGTGTMDGVPVTEYTGTLSIDKSLSDLSGSVKTQLEQAVASEGFTTATFTVWIDGQHRVRRDVVIETGKDVTEKVDVTLTSINQPSSITVPPAGQTAPLPSADAGSLG